MIYYIRKHWRINLLVAILQIAWAALQVIANVVMIQVGQSILELDMNCFLNWCMLQAVLWTLICFLQAARTWAKSKSTLIMNNHVRADMVATMLKMTHQEFHHRQSGEYLSWFTNDVKRISELAWDSFFGYISLGAQIIFSIMALAKMHWSLLAFSLVVAVIIIYFPKLFEKKIKMLSESCAKEQAQAMSKMKDLLAGFDVLRFFGCSNRFVKDNRDSSNELEWPIHKLNCVQAYIGQGINLINTFCQLSVSLFIGILSIKGIIIQSAILGGGNLCGSIYGGLTTCSDLRVAVAASKPYFDKITVHADEVEQVCEGAIEPLKRNIIVSQLNFSYEEKKVLLNANMCFGKGGKYALIGPSGCGKTTLLKVLLGWLPEYTGQVQYDGVDIREFSTEQLQQQMSYIEQDVFLFNTTIRDNITLGGDYSELQIEQAIKGSALDIDLVNMPLGLDTPVGENGSSLSGGQKQRVAIARALIHNRSILLIDEGTSALDQKNADIVEQHLLGNPELTLILVSHHLSEERKRQFTKVLEMEPVLLNDKEEK